MKHLSEEMILRFLDGELPRPEAEVASRHLSECWSCRARANDLESAITGFMHFQQAAVPPPTVAAQIAAQQPSPLWRRCWPALILLPLAFGLWSYWPHARPAYLPDPQLTPGATRSISLDQVCAIAREDNPPPPPQLARKVFANYGIAVPPAGQFEVDFLIDPLLGGAEDERNLWPQPFQEGKWNARVKDALEDLLREKVCKGQMDLATAQAEMARDWVAAYRRHFRTRDPIAAHALFVKDKPWE